MVVTRETVAQKLTAYLQQRVTLKDLVDWAERALMDGEFAGEEIETVRDIVARLGLADVLAFGLTWEDCLTYLRRLGYSATAVVEPLPSQY
ncbi:MAG: hypothetical protein AB1609_14750 [Bacillota bacterium]